MFPILGAVVLSTGCLSSSESQQADPVVVENPVIFIKRPLMFDENTGALVEDNLADPSAFRPGARLFLKKSASADSTIKDISSSAFSAAPASGYDVKDLHVSHDGRRVLFAMRAPEIEGADDDEQPTWNIWEYDLDSAALSRVIDSDVIAKAGQDIAPAYLPDGRIVFSSTRQRASKAILLDEGKPQFTAQDEEGDSPAFVLHVMDDDGGNIEQITFNQSHDLDPLVAEDGKILFSRWDNAGQTRNNGVNLYSVNPDGTELGYLYGRHSHDTSSGSLVVHYLNPQKTDSGSVLAQLRPFESADYASYPVEVSVAQYVEADLRVDGAPGSGQRALVTGAGFAGEVSLNGSFGAVSPLLDGTGRYLVSWTPCRLRETAGNRIVNCTQERLNSENYEPAEPVYGLWLFDIAAGTQRPVVEPVEGEQFDEAVLMRERPLETFIPESQFPGEEATLADSGYGVLHIRSVYDVDGTDTAPGSIAATADPAQTDPNDRPARFLRLEKPVSMPDDSVRDFDNSAFGRSRGQLMREILGYVPIEPDGSVKVAVPANVAFAVSVLDANGQRLGARHQNWLTVRPGETLECNGCHNPNSGISHGRADATPASVWPGAATTGLPFPNTESSLFADMGETMAEAYGRINQIRKPAPNVVYADEWTDSAVVPKADSFDFSYSDLQTQAPISTSCSIEWAANCRIVINYEQHIHPLWDLSREVRDSDGVVVADYTCTGCHTDRDAAGAQQVPVAQLDLTDGPSPDEPDHLKAYRELLFPDNQQELSGGALIDVLVDSGDVLRDDEGNPILDANGDPQPIFETVPVNASMSVNGAAASSVFLNVFRRGGTHEGFLSPAELRLISEWLDIGAQYWNNPFLAPEN
ncbi:hypothetical protein D777_00711 [Marinobacter nitratireducens]|uniref:Hydrazine synthase alpha subunit middle domain-containing protein n=2 Tax=Marinobacter nitratireducens TaxID=1137280 RepID=A0A072N4B3_9GAMM|nr:hypothetical protein D777_00711 [Marinobacter nitratireducens]